MDALSFGLLSLNALALIVVAVQNYRNAGTLELMKSFNNYLLSYVVVWMLIFLLAFSIPANVSMGSSLDDLAKGNLKFSASGGGLLCCPILIPIFCVIAYVFTRIPGNDGKFSYALFALLLLQQLWYAFDSANPHNAMMWLGVLYTAGFFVVLFIGGAMGGKLLSLVFPNTERRHEEWVQSVLADPNFGANDPAARMIKMNLQASTPSTQAPDPNGTQIIFNERTRPLFIWKPCQVAAALVGFSIWNVLMYAIPAII